MATELEVTYEAMDQALRPLSDAIEKCWHEIYRDYVDDIDDKPMKESVLSDLLEYASTVAFEVEFQRKHK